MLIIGHVFLSFVKLMGEGFQLQTFYGEQQRCSCCEMHLPCNSIIFYLLPPLLWTAIKFEVQAATRLQTRT